MRIDLYSSAATEASEQSNKSTQTASADATQSAQNTEDTTNLSASSDTVQSLTQTALQTDSARAQKVESLKQSVSSGQYKLDAGQIADSLANADV